VRARALLTPRLLFPFSDGTCAPQMKTLESRSLNRAAKQTIFYLLAAGGGTSWRSHRLSKLECHPGELVPGKVRRSLEALATPKCAGSGDRID
jgi:hypothetical protein